VSPSTTSVTWRAGPRGAALGEPELLHLRADRLEVEVHLGEHDVLELGLRSDENNAGRLPRSSTIRKRVT
jgi:hypothetical protein